MEKQQELEWNEAQRIGISVDLVSVAKHQLKFLSTVDRNRSLYEGPVLLRAIYRYNAFWLPLLAKHSKLPLCEGPLVVPLDCEWIWHCHRLNPIQYKSDCEELYGSILDNRNVMSTIEETSQAETEGLWRKLYPEEPYILDLTMALSEDFSEKTGSLENSTKYDLVSAVERQTPFAFQMARPHMSDDQFLQGALTRYKGFLHLIRTNRQRSLKRFCVPTYDIDLMWHSHQLNPVSYCDDLTVLIGKVLGHDDTDSDRTKGMKLDVGFSGTTKQYEDTFGRRYWKAGAMYRGSTPASVAKTPFTSEMINKKVVTLDEFKHIIEVSEAKSVEVFLECVEVGNLPEGHKGNLSVSFSKTQPDIFFDATRKLTILSESKVKQVSSFHCEPTGELLLELTSQSHSTLSLTKAPKTLGTTSIAFQDLLVPTSNLSDEKWLDLVPSTGNVSSKPIRLRVSVSITIPVSAERVLHMVHSRPSLKISCFLPFPGIMKDDKSKTHVIDEAGNIIISLKIRNPEKAMTKDKLCEKKVIGIKSSGEVCTLAEYVGTGWSLLNSHWSLHSCKNSTKDSPIFELVGSKMVKFYRGKKLEYETRRCEKHKNERDFMTAVEFSTKDPYGKAVALINLKSGNIRVKEEWMVLTSFVSFMILSDMVKDQYDSFAAMDEATTKTIEETKTVDDGNNTNGTLETEKGALKTGAGCGSGCGGGGGGCGDSVESGGCAAKVAVSGGCGGGCGSGGCGGCGGGGCGNVIQSGGCGGCGGGGCGGGCGHVIHSGDCSDCGGSGGCAGCGGDSSDKLAVGPETNNVPVLALNTPVAA